jgi:hypothetical protein
MKDSNEKKTNQQQQQQQQRELTLLTHPKCIVHSLYGLSQSASETADPIHNKKKRKK